MAITRTSSAPAQLTPEQQALADDLVRCHGNLKIAREASGLHFYIACPECLQSDGEPELWKMHLAINVDKYLSGHTGAARCMKTSMVFRVDELTLWLPLEKRGYDRGPGKIANQNLITEETHEPDEQGRWVPKGPGIVIPLTQLPEDHPCIQYVRSRTFDPAALEAQFGAGYCQEDRKDLHYRKLVNGFKASPKGRLVLPIWQKGMRVGWQARILDAEDELNHYYWNPWQKMWVAVETRESPRGDWNKLPGWEEFDPPKYLMAQGAKRNQILMGYDAAIAYNLSRKRRIGLVVEGPLDAARLGPPAVALCGKVCSHAQADLLAEAFDVIVTVPDNDQAGARMHSYVAQWIGTCRNVIEFKLPPRWKDAGELTPLEAAAFRGLVLSQAALPQ